MWKTYLLKKIVCQQRCESKRVYMCSTIVSTKRPPKRKQKQVWETDGRPSCKPGSCGRSGNGGVWGRRFAGGPGRTHRGTKAEGCEKRCNTNGPRMRGTSGNRPCGARVLVWTLHASSSNCSSTPNSFTR